MHIQVLIQQAACTVPVMHLPPMYARWVLCMFITFMQAGSKQPNPETQQVIQMIRKLQRMHGCGLSEIAVLYRLQKMVRVMA
jgi:hypothetical protein